MSGLMAFSASYPNPNCPGLPARSLRRRYPTSPPAAWRSPGPSGVGHSAMPRLPGFLLLNCPPMSGSVTPQRRRGPFAGGPPADGSHGRHAGVRWLFSSTLMLSAPKALRNRAAGGSQKPGEVQDADAMQGERFAVGREFFGDRPMRRGITRRLVARRRCSHGLGILVQQRRPPADRPGGRRAEPFAGGVAEGATQFRVFDIRATVAASQCADRERSRGLRSGAQSMPASWASRQGTFS